VFQDIRGAVCTAVVQQLWVAIYARPLSEE